MIGIVVSIITLSIIISFINLQKDNSTSGGRIVVQFNSGITNIIRFGYFLFIAVSVVMFISYLIYGGTIWLGSLIFAIFSILTALLYLKLKNSKVIYENGFISEYNMFGKGNTYNVGDIENAVEETNMGVRLFLKNGKLIKVSAEMNNYKKLREKLAEHNIVYKNNVGVESPKGW